MLDEELPRYAEALKRLKPRFSGRTPPPGLDAKAAALLHPVARNYALIDGNKRLALAATIAFYGLSGRRLTLTNDAACDLVMDVATGGLDVVDEIAAVLRQANRRGTQADASRLPRGQRRGAGGTSPASGGAGR